MIAADKPEPLVRAFEYEIPTVSTSDYERLVYIRLSGLQKIDCHERSENEKDENE